MVLLAVDPYCTILLGALILAAVWINSIRTVRMERAR
jgi:hypothetical protein